MKIQIISFLLTLLALKTSFASKARLDGLGQSTLGSQYLQDERNILQNPAYVNKFNKFINMDWGSDGSSPTGEAQIYTRSKTWSYGVFLGRDIDNSRGSFLDKLNSNEVTLGRTYKDYTLGGTFWYYWGQDMSTSGVTKSAKAYGLRFGTIKEKWESFIELDLSNDATGSSSNDDRWEADFSYNLGGSYHLSRASTLFTKYSYSGYRQILSGNDFNNKDSTYLIGYGRDSMITERSLWFYDIQLKMTRSGVTKTRTIPLTMGIETQALDWLKVRGSFTGNLQHKETTIETTPSLETTGNGGLILRTGLSLTFDGLSIDGSIADSSINSGALMIGSATASEISLSYKF